MDILTLGACINAVKNVDNKCETIDDKFDDILKDLIIIKRYTATFNIGANASVSITGNNFNVVIPEGYYGVTVRQYAVSNDKLFYRVLSPQSSGTSAIVRVTNSSDTAYTDVTCTIDIVYIKQSIVKIA